MSELLNVKQNTDEWMSERKKRLGASDIPIILGLSPYKTAYELWEEKTGRVINEYDTESFAARYAQRGHDLEPHVRERVNIQKKKNYIADVCFVEDYYIASLDGWDEETRTVLEIKCPGKVDYAEALKGEVPLKWVPQVQWQLYVAEARYGLLAVHPPEGHGDKLLFIKYEYDDEYIADIKNDIDFFWNCVENDIEPELKKTDMKKSSDELLNMAIIKHKELQYQGKLLKKKVDESKNVIENLMDHPRLECPGGKVITVYKKGNVDYKKVPAIKLMTETELNKYRNKSSSHIKIS